MRLTHLMILTAMCSSLMSCASRTLQGYEGAALLDDETALIVVQMPERMRGVRRAEITSVQLPHGTMAVETRRARVLPGDTCIAVHALSDSLESSSGSLCFEAEAGESYELRVRTVPTDSDREGYRAFRIDSFRLINRDTREYVAISARGTADCESTLVGQVARRGRGGMGTAGGRGRALECEDSE